MFGKLKKRKSKLPESTGHVIDFAHMYWGHNIEGARPDEEGKWEAYCWVTPSPREGDEVVWRTNYGLAYSIVTEVDWYPGVDDMFKLRGVVVRRETTEGKPVELSKE